MRLLVFELCWVPVSPLGFSGEDPLMPYLRPNIVAWGHGSLMSNLLFYTVWYVPGLLPLAVTATPSIFGLRNANSIKLQRLRVWSLYSRRYHFISRTQITLFIWTKMDFSSKLCFQKLLSAIASLLLFNIYLPLLTWDACRHRIGKPLGITPDYLNDFRCVCVRMLEQKLF